MRFPFVRATSMNGFSRTPETPTAPFSYMFTGEYEMPEWNLAYVCN
jgi:hypothetical protein